MRKFITIGDVEMKKIVLCILIGFYFATNVFCDGQDENLKIANQYYDADDYTAAEEYFKKAIVDDNTNGIVFYRLGYSLENTHSNDSLMKESYKAAVFCFERDFETDNKYFEKAKSKLEQYGLTKNYSEQELQAFIMTLNGKNNNSITKDPIILIASYLLNLSKNTKIILIVIAILIYVLAWFLSMGDKCTIVYTWWDMILLLVSGSIFCFNLWILSDGGQTDNSLAVSLVFIVSLILSFIISFIANIGNPFPFNILYSLVSVLTKTVLILIVPIIVLMALESFRAGKKDKRYRDGTEKNKKTFVVTLVFLFIALLVLPLIKANKNSKISKTIENFGDEEYTIRFIQKWNRILGR